MSPQQYRDAIARLGLSQEAAGLWLGVSKRTGQTYASKGPTEPVAKFIRLVLALKLTAQRVERLTS